MKKMRSAKQVKTVNNILVHTALAILAAVWVFPIIWVVLTSFRAEKGSYVSTFFPKAYTLANYTRLFTDTTILNFPRMFANTLFIAVCSCILSTFYVLAVSYCLSRLKFRMRKPYMNMAMILGLFPGFMSMVAVYFILKALGLTEGNLIRLALILCYSGGAGLTFQIAKGFFDTDYHLHGADLLYLAVGGFYLCKGNLPRQFGPVYDSDRFMENAGKRIY